MRLIKKQLAENLATLLHMFSVGGFGGTGLE